MDRICPSWNLKSCKSFPAVRSHTYPREALNYCHYNDDNRKLQHLIVWLVITFTALSNPPETTQRPSGVNLIVLMPWVWPLYVWLQPFFRISQILRLVSLEPDAKNSPNGWNSTAVQFDLWPERVRTTALQEHCKRSEVINEGNQSYVFLHNWRCKSEGIINEQW